MKHFNRITEQESKADPTCNMSRSLPLSSILALSTPSAWISTRATTHSKGHNKKKSKHGGAVKAGGATFVPFIMETDGLLHYGAIEVIKLSRQLTYHMRSSFVNDMRRTLSIALAKENSKAVCTALTRSNCYASMGGNSCLRRRVPLV